MVLFIANFIWISNYSSPIEKAQRPQPGLRSGLALHATVREPPLRNWHTVTTRQRSTIAARATPYIRVPRAYLSTIAPVAQWSARSDDCPCDVIALRELLNARSFLKSCDVEERTDTLWGLGEALGLNPSRSIVSPLSLFIFLSFCSQNAGFQSAHVQTATGLATLNASPEEALSIYSINFPVRLRRLSALLLSRCLEIVCL